MWCESLGYFMATSGSHFRHGRIGGFCFGESLFTDDRFYGRS